MQPLQLVRFAARVLLTAGLAPVVGATVLLLVPGAAEAQAPPSSLGELARKEAERRKTIKDTKKLTEKDLPESARKPATPPAPTPAAAAATEGSAEAGSASAEQKPASGGATASAEQKDENHWRGRITQARESLRRNEMFRDALQTRINALGNDFNNSSNQIQQLKIAGDRQKAVEELARVTSEVELAKKQIDDVEEEARKAGVPPGWLR
jgi:hypothetical protein